MVNSADKRPSYFIGSKYDQITLLRSDLAMPILEISVVPVGSSTPSFSSNVSQAVNIIKQKGLNYQVTPTATVIEGNIDELMDVAKQIHQNEIATGTQRVVTNITIDDRIDKSMTLANQVEAVEQDTH